MDHLFNGMIAGDIPLDDLVAVPLYAEQEKERILAATNHSKGFRRYNLSFLILSSQI